MEEERIPPVTPFVITAVVVGIIIAVILIFSVVLVVLLCKGHVCEILKTACKCSNDIEHAVDDTASSREMVEDYARSEASKGLGQPADNAAGMQERERLLNGGQDQRNSSTTDGVGHRVDNADTDQQGVAQARHSYHTEVPVTVHQSYGSSIHSPAKHKDQPVGRTPQENSEDLQSNTNGSHATQDEMNRLPEENGPYDLRGPSLDQSQQNRNDTPSKPLELNLQVEQQTAHCPHNLPGPSRDQPQQSSNDTPSKTLQLDLQDPHQKVLLTPTESSVNAKSISWKKTQHPVSHETQL